MSIIEEIYFEIVLIEESDKIRSWKLNVLYLILQDNGGDQARLVFLLLNCGVTVKNDLLDGKHKHYFLLIAEKVLLMLSFTLKMGFDMFKDQ